MKRFVALAAIAVVCTATCSRLDAQQAYTIKLKKLGAGDAAVVKEKTTGVEKVKIRDEAGKVLTDQTVGIEEEFEFTETILKTAPKDRTKTKLVRKYGIARTAKDGVSEGSPLQGKTVHIENKNGAYQFTYESGAEITGDAAITLAKEFNSELAAADAAGDIYEVLLPKQAVKVGEKWDVNLRLLTKRQKQFEDMEFDAAKSSGSGMLTKVYEKNGARYGVMNVKVEMSLLSVGKGDEGMKFDNGARLVVVWSIEKCIDGTLSSGTCSMKAELAGTGKMAQQPNSVVTMEGGGRIHQSLEETAKKEPTPKK